MSNYKTTETQRYEIGLSVDGSRGYFEHKTLGEDKAGGLWFEDGRLVDYDGVWSLPNEVMIELRSRGVDVSHVEVDNVN